MEIQVHDDIAELTANGLIINNAEEGFQILADQYYQGFDKIILYEKNITPEFFDLKTRLAGEILQKFSNYKVRLVIIGEFNYPAQSLADFIRESNKGKLVNFAAHIEEALARLA